LLSGTKRWTFIAENKRKPQFTSIIAASSGAMKADEVAKKALDGVKSASFIIPCNFEESYCPLRLLVNPLRDRA
jgi:3-dehydrosphinganine reductase